MILSSFYESGGIPGTVLAAILGKAIPISHSADRSHGGVHSSEYFDFGRRSYGHSSFQRSLISSDPKPLPLVALLHLLGDP